LRKILYIVALLLGSCADIDQLPVYDCSFVPLPLQKILKPGKVQYTVDDANDIINDPVHNVAMVAECKMDWSRIR
jgi:hypothetical protein